MNIWNIHDLLSNISTLCSMLRPFSVKRQDKLSHNLFLVNNWKRGISKEESRDKLNAITCHINNNFNFDHCNVLQSNNNSAKIFTYRTSSRSIKTQKKNEVNIQPSWPNKLGQERTYTPQSISSFYFIFCLYLFSPSLREKMMRWINKWKKEAQQFALIIIRYMNWLPRCSEALEG